MTYENLLQEAVDDGYTVVEKRFKSRTRGFGARTIFVEKKTGNKNIFCERIRRDIKAWHGPLK
jgi:hypothetical protein